MGNVSDTSSSPDPAPAELATTKLVFQIQLRNELRNLATTDGNALSISNVPIDTNVLETYANCIWTGKRDCHEIYNHFVYPNGQKEHNFSLEDLFEHCGKDVGIKRHRPVKAIAIGEMGTGKTTLAQMAVYLWSNGELWSEKFDLAASLSLGNPDVQQARSLEELLGLVLSDSAMSDGVCAAEYFTRYPERLCLILDGLSECHSPSCSEFMQGVMKIRELRAVRLLVVSRPCPAVPVLKKTGLYQRHVEVAGLKADAVTNLIRRQVAISEDADALLAEVSRNLELEALMTSPTFASLSCANTATTHSCLAAALEEQIVRAFRNVGMAMTGLRRDVPSDCAAVLHKLARFAFSMTVRHRVTFTDAEMRSLAGEALRLGLVTSHTDLGARSCHHRFVSLALQEYLAAWYVSHGLIASKEHAAILVQRLSACSYDLRVFWRYAIALSPSCGAADWLMSALWSDTLSKKDKDEPLSSLRPLDENDVPGISLDLGAEQEESSEVRDRLYKQMSREQMHQLADDLLSRVDATISGRQLVYDAIGRGDDETAVTDSAYMATLLLLWRQRTPVTSGTHLHAALERYAPEAAADLKLLLVPEWLLVKLIPDPIRIGGTRFRQNDAAQVMLMEAYFEHCRLQYAPGAGMPEFDVLHSLKPVGLNLSEVTLTLQQCSIVAMVLSNHGNAASEWEIAGCSPENSGMLRLAPVVKDFGKLRWINVSNCGITDGTLLVPVLSDLPELIDLNISENRIGDTGLAAIFPALTQARNLTTFRSKAMGLTNRSLPVVIELVAGWKKLHYLYVDENDFGDAGRDVELAFLRVVKESTIEQLFFCYKTRDGTERTIADELKEVKNDVAFSLESLWCPTS